MMMCEMLIKGKYNSNKVRFQGESISINKKNTDQITPSLKSPLCKTARCSISGVHIHASCIKQYYTIDVLYCTIIFPYIIFFPDITVAPSSEGKIQ